MRYSLLFMATSCYLFLNCMVYAETPQPFQISSNDFQDNNVLPVLYTCDGKGISPHITWTALNSRVQSLVLTLSSKDKEGKEQYYWILYNIPTTVRELPEGIALLPDEVKTIQNSFNTTLYHPICPELGGIGFYTYTAYALDTKLNLPMGSGVDALLQALKGHIVQTDTLIGVYSRWPVKLD